MTRARTALLVGAALVLAAGWKFTAPAPAASTPVRTETPSPTAAPTSTTEAPTTTTTAAPSTTTTEAPAQPTTTTSAPAPEPTTTTTGPPTTTSTSYPNEDLHRYGTGPDAGAGYRDAMGNCTVADVNGHHDGLTPAPECLDPDTHQVPAEQWPTTTTTAGPPEGNDQPLP